MRFLRVACLAMVLPAFSAAPSFAATYAWPVMLSQPLNVTNLSLPPGNTLVLFCYVSTKGSILPMGVGQVPVPAAATAGGGFSYSGTVAVAVNPAPGLTTPPQAGNVASCGLRASGNTAVNIGAPSSFTLP